MHDNDQLFGPIMHHNFTQTDAHFCYLAQVSRGSSAQKDSFSITGLRFRRLLVKWPLENWENNNQLSSLVVETPDLFCHLQHLKKVCLRHLACFWFQHLIATDALCKKDQSKVLKADAISHNIYLNTQK